MADPILRAGAWWQEQPDGTWLRLNPDTRAWEPREGGPPPPTALEARSSRPYSPARGWATAVTALLSIVVIVDVIAVFSDLAEYALLHRAETSGITLEEANANDSRQALIGVIQFLLFVVTGIIFIVWFHRCYANLTPLGAFDLRFGTGWAVGGWFVPILALWRPKQIANDIWRGSDPEKPFPLTIRASEPVPPLMNWWWGAWIASSWVGQFLLRTFRDASTLPDLQNLSRVTLASDVLSALGGVLAIAVVRLLTTRQEERAQKQGRVPATS